MRTADFVTFIVDTGATVTSILTSDIMRLGIKYDDLSVSGRVMGVGGGVETRQISDILLTFITEDGSPHIERLSRANAIESRALFSTLGVDILSRSKLVYSKNEAYLEILDQTKP